MFSRFVVHGLTTGEQYIFRVKAVNAVGTSENSQESDVIKVQAALSKSCSGGSAPAPGSSGITYVSTSAGINFYDAVWNITRGEEWM